MDYLELVLDTELSLYSDEEEETTHIRFVDPTERALTAVEDAIKILDQQHNKLHDISLVLQDKLASRK